MPRLLCRNSDRRDKYNEAFVTLRGDSLFLSCFCALWVHLRLSKAADMDHHWVAKAWLSDVGLLQYSQSFHNQLVDGRMLNSLTRRDLERFLNVTKKFHQISLLLGIELLHGLNFDKEVRLAVSRQQ